MYQLRLVRGGHRVMLAGDGPSGPQAAIAHPPDLLLLDLRLPGFNGFELLARLRHEPAGAAMPVIVLSSYSDQELIDHGRELRALAHLVKSQTTPVAPGGGDRQAARRRGSSADRRALRGSPCSGGGRLPPQGQPPERGPTDRQAAPVIDRGRGDDRMQALADG